MTLEDTINRLSVPKSKNFSEVITQRLIKTAPQPLWETKTFYNEFGKSIKINTKIGNPKEKQLEQVGKKIFTGVINYI